MPVCPVCEHRLDGTESTCPQCGAVLSDATTVISGEAPTPSPDVPSALADELHPSYELLRPLGAGGMGRVFLARDTTLNRFVAIKLMSPEFATDAKARQRFQREAESAARIVHPNVVAVHGVGELRGGQPYLVLQYVEGANLAERVAAPEALELPEALGIIRAVADGLATAHQHGIIHRDVKPANVLLDRATGRALVTDFGIATLEASPDPGATALTGEGMMIGTPTYMSPEQLTGERVTAATDVYALGVLAYEVLTGVPPFGGRTPQELVAAKLRDPVPPMKAGRSPVPADIESLVGRCLDREPSLRPAARDVATQLDAMEQADVRAGLVGTALVVAAMLFAYLSLGAWWLIRIVGSVADRSEGSDFVQGLRFGVMNWVYPMGVMVGGLLAFTVLALGFHVQRVRQRQHALRRTLRLAFASPGGSGVAVLLAVSLVVVAVPLVYVVPTLESLAARVATQLPLSLRLVMATSSFLQVWWPVLAASILLLLFAARRLMRR